MGLLGVVKMTSLEGVVSEGGEENSALGKSS